MRNRGKSNLHLPVANILTNPQRDWQILTRGHMRFAADNPLAVDWDTYNQNDYLMAHCSIVASVNTAENGYYIEHPCDELVNSNGNAWTTPVLLATFKSFVGKPIYQEHVQIPELSKGKILDAVVRPVKFKGSDGSEANVFYCDLLTATDKRHTDLVEKIESGECDTLSMGCLAHRIQCSKCGGIFGDNEKSCDHIAHELLNYFTDEKGNKRIVSELCGSAIKTASGKLEADPKSLEFIEASWVAKPAFKGAVVNHFVSQIDKKAAKILAFPTNHSILDLQNIFDLRVADKESMIVLKLIKERILKAKDMNLIDRIADYFV